MSRMWPTLDSTTYPEPRYPAMVLALEGDSTMTSLVPPLLLTFEAVPVFAFAFAVAFLAGTLFPSCNPRGDRLATLWSPAALQL
jgi:hypothetical protein